MSAPFILSANSSRLMIDGKDVPGVKQIDFQVRRNTENIYSLSGDRPIGTHMGAFAVRVSLTIRSAFEDLDKKMLEPISSTKDFQMILETGKQGSDEVAKKYIFDKCYLESRSFAADATNVPYTTYNITAEDLTEE